MSNTEEQNQTKEQKTKLPAGHPRARHLLITLLLVTAAAALFLAWYMRPIPRANRKLADFGLTPIPESATDIRIEMGKLTYVRFSADPNTVTKYVGWLRIMIGRNVYIAQAKLANITKGGPSWFTPSMYTSQPSSDNRFYFLLNARVHTIRHQGRKPEHVMNEQHTVYILLRSGRTPLDRILNWLRRVF